MKRSFMTRALAFCLSAALLLGNVAPAYAAEANTTEPQILETGDETTLSSPIISEVVEEETEQVDEPQVQQYEPISYVHVNPLYADIISEEDILAQAAIAMVSEDVTYYTSIDDAAMQMRTDMVNRTTTISVGYEYEGEYDGTYAQSVSSEIAEKALEHTGVATEGDYLKWQYGGYQSSIGASMSGGVVSLTITYTVSYYTNAEQEAELTAAIEEWLPLFQGETEFDTIQNIYNHLYQNVTYDNDNLEDDSYLLKYTAYAAMVNGTSVCQGFAVLFYRLALECGIDARVITGDAGGAHAWNIVKLNDLYYNLDATWDSGADMPIWFLLSDEDFTEHTRDEAYLSESFMAQYPMAEESYVIDENPEDNPTDDPNGDGTEGVPPIDEEDPEENIPGDEPTQLVAPEISCVTDADGNVESFEFLNNSSQEVSFCFEMIPEEQVEQASEYAFHLSSSPIQSAESHFWEFKECLSYLVANEFEYGRYYLCAYAESEYGSSEVVSLEIPITISEESYDGTGITFELDETSSEEWKYYGFGQEQLPDGAIVDYIEYSVMNEEDEIYTSKAYLADSEEYEEDSTGFAWDLEFEWESNPTFTELRYSVIEVNDNEILIKTTIIPQEYLSKEIADESEGEVDENSLPAPSMEVILDEDGDFVEIQVTNNAQEEVEISYGIIPKNSTNLSELTGSGDTFNPGAVKTLSISGIADHINAYYDIESGEYYFAVHAYSVGSNRESEVIILEDYPVIVKNTVIDDTTINMGNETSRYYLMDFSENDYNDVVYEYQYLTDEGYSLESYFTEEKRNLYSIDTERMNADYNDWTLKKIKGISYEIDSQGCTFSICSATNFVYGTYDESQMSTPSFWMYYEDAVLEAIEIYNYDSVERCIYYGFATEQEIEAGVDLNEGRYIEGDSFYLADLRNLVARIPNKAGEYYLVAYAQENDQRSDLAILKEFPFIVKTVGHSETVNILQGNITGALYLNGITTDDYMSVDATIQLKEYVDGNPEEYIPSYIEERFDTEFESFNISGNRIKDISDACDEWNIKTLYLKNIVEYSNSCKITVSFSEAFSFEEFEESVPDAPSLTLIEDEEGNVTSFNVYNNSSEYGTMWYGILTEEEIANGNTPNMGCGFDGYVEEEITLKEVITARNHNWTAETYYLTVQFESYETGIFSELVVLEDFPIVITETESTDTYTYETGDETGYYYFRDFAEDECDYVTATLLCGDSEGTWNSWPILNTNWGYYYLNPEEFNDLCGDWSIESLTIGTVSATLEGCNVSHINIPKIEASGTYEEPKAAAPSMELYRDGEGNVVGVQITNNITHDNGTIHLDLICEDQAEAYLETFSMDAGETIVYLFEDIEHMLYNLHEEEWVYTLTCYAIDWESGLESKKVTLDYPVTVEVNEYIGDDFVVYTEVNDNNKGWYYIDTAVYPEYLNMINLTYDVSYDENGNKYETSIPLKLTEDGQYWYGSTYLDEDAVIYAIAMGIPEATDEGLNIAYTVIPQEKIILEERELSRKPVTFLDYDYYNAFIASGGSVSVEDGEVIISTDNFFDTVKWTLDYLHQWFEGTGLYRLVKNITNAVKEDANKYWKCDAGSFKAKNYYDIDGNEISEDSLSKHDIVLIEYAPEIVWVDSMELTAPETMEAGEEATVEVTLDAGQDKYPFGRTPQVRFESSDSDILEVDAETGALIAGTKSGTVTITAYADEDLRAEEGLSEIVTASVEITVEGENESEDDKVIDDTISVPSYELEYDDNGNVSGLYLTNNDSVERLVWIVASPDVNSREYVNGVYLEGGDTGYYSLEEIIDSLEEKEATYQFSVCAEDYDNDLYSESVEIANYSVDVSTTTITDTVTLAEGNLTGNLYLTDFTTEEYSRGSAVLELKAADCEDWETNFVGIGATDEMLYINGSGIAEYEEWYEEWNITGITLKKYEYSPTECNVVIATADKFVFDTYTESYLEAPTIELAKDDNGEIFGLRLINNSSSANEVAFDFLTEEEIQNAVKPNNNSMSFFWEEEMDINLKSFFKYSDKEAGTYYFTCYVYDYDGFYSETVVLDDYPIVITSEEVDETATYHKGDLTGYNYFKDYSAEEYDFLRVTLLCREVDEDGNEYTWNSNNSLDVYGNLFYFADSAYDDWAGDWSVQSMKLGKVTATEESFNLAYSIYSTVEEGEAYVEPQAAAPSIELYRDDEGNVVGVQITNNISHDNGSVEFGYCWENERGSISSSANVYRLKSGETKYILFEDMMPPDEDLRDKDVKIYCRSQDDDLNLESKRVLLDYEVCMETEQYSGDGIDVFWEKDLEGNIWYYVPIKETPDSIRTLGMTVLVDADDNFFDTIHYLKSDDNSYWRMIWRDEVVSIEGMVYTKMQPEETILKVIYTDISKEKIALTERELSRKQVLLLDYDYYNAFIASGGSVTVEDGEVVISTDNFIDTVKWTLDYLHQWFEGTGLYRLVKNITNAVKEDANKYWKSEEGSFKAKNYYDIDGNEISADSLSKHDIVLIEYAPEIVWVDSMELTAPDKMEVGTTAVLTATADAGQDKYPFGRTPQIRFESSDPEVLEVDAETGALTAGDVTGTVIITAYADEDLRAEEGLSEIVTASVTIQVVDVHEHVYDYELESPATFETDGKLVGTCSCEEVTDEKIIYKAASVELSETSYIYDGEDKQPEVTVKDSQGTALKPGTDYNVSYKNNNMAGTATATITLIGNYSGTKEVDFTIKQRSLVGAVVADIAPQEYTGSAIEPEVYVNLGELNLTLNDYTVSYASNINKGTAVVTVTGTGNYYGTAIGTFEITARELEESMVAPIGTFEYTGKAIEPEVIVTFGETKLVEGTDYTVLYSNNMNVGTAIVTVNGTGNFAGTVTAHFGITAKELEESMVAEITSCEYTGEAVEPVVTVTYGAEVLTAGKDFTAVYTNNVNVGTANVTITGKGDYSGTVETTFEITPKAITPEMVEDFTSYVYTGKEIKAEVVVKDGEKVLAEGTDYTVGYGDNVNVGNANVVVTGKGNYDGIVGAIFEIAPKEIDTSMLGTVASVTYTGEAIEPEVVVTFGETELIAETDYTVSYTNNINAGTAIVIVNGKGNFTGTAETSFEITPKMLEESMEVKIDTQEYTGAEVKPAVVITDNEKTLVAGVDFTVEYSNNVELGTATAEITGTGNYTGSLMENFTITERILKPSMIAAIGEQTYNGGDICPEVVITVDGITLIEDLDYTVEYFDNVEAGEATVEVTGLGNYAGNVTVNFTIKGKTLIDSMIEEIMPEEYTGKALKPDVFLNDNDLDVSLEEGIDYTVSYSNNVNAGTATVKVTGKGNYVGTVTKTFKIEAREIGNCAVTVTEKMTYTGKTLIPTVTVKDAGTTLKNGTAYTISYSANKNPGEAIVKITGKGNYTGTVEESFVIVPKKATMNSVTASSSVEGRLTVKWTKDSLADGYMLQYSTDKGFDSGVETEIIEGAGTTSMTLSGLKEGKTYYVRVASFVTADDDEYRGSYSSAKSAKTKKGFSVKAIAEQDYTGKALKPKVTVKNGSTTLKEGTDYTVSYSNNTKPGEATVKVKGRGNYAGTEVENFIIVPKEATLKSVTSTGVGKLKVKWSKDSLASGYILQYSTSSKFSSSKTVTLDITKYSTVSKTIKGLTEGKTYYVRVAAYKTIDGEDFLGSYSTKDSVKVKASFTVKAISDKTYTGSSIEPSVTVKFGNKTLKKGTDYTVSYSSNKNPGTATVKVTGKGNYAGTEKVTFKIVPKKATITTVKSTKAGRLTVKWEKDAKADGYFLQYSTSKKFTEATTETIYIKKYSTVSKTIKNLVSGKKYYVRVATYKNIDDVMERGSYSSVKYLKVK